MSIGDISLLSALLAGALSFLSPCVLPLVPPYLCYMAGISVDQLKGGGEAKPASQWAVLLPAFFFTLGFATIFVALGAGASTIGQLLRQYMDILSKVGGVIIILMGLHFLGVLRIPILAREARFHGGGKPASVTGAYIMGLAFAFGWTPCIGPVLGAILAVAATKATVSNGAVLLAVYSLGLAVPFWIAAYFSGAFMRFLTRFRKHLGAVEKIMGVLLILTGVAFLFGFIADMAIWFQQTFPVLSRIG
ncbi:cytochrome c biogenesis protein CcdA [Martelella mediterranea]|uniref:cytochrome c biogenesis CcdA family protein n=1 Tax=Martelella TaxID=293088 RepID=UPI000C37D583|nr:MULTISPECIES: cytochrome c biogenesis protein CcdA [Martelella]MAU18942.1 cytochrome C biogenesis protein [Martelella sp.]MCD1632153.1 cytochrome c biogenesis protein CcdA [Martelella mediterranea]